MKLSSIALTAVSATIALAQPHNHGHQHVHKHKRDVTETAWAPGPTSYKYVLNGEEITPEEVCEGLKDNELKFVDGQDPGVCSSSTSGWSEWSSTASSTAAQPTTSSSTTSSAAAESSSKPAEFYPASSAWSSSSEAASSWAPAQSSSAPSTGSGGSGVDAEFPDGSIGCDTFPSQYGAVAVDYLGLKGWSGLQAVTIAGGLVNHIVTGISGEGCKDGSMCSYACPPGYQKSQWPDTQGATGQSVGGLKCLDGKLHLTNPSLSKKLCIPGVGGVQATNKAGGVVSICRTDYPGTESETIPVELGSGETEELTVPDAAAYYEWQGKSTSAQYYLNPIGIGKEKACQWGTPGQPYGNYAPINFGVGAKDGKTWLSIFQNAPTTTEKYQGTVEIQGSLSGQCKYQNGQYCGVTGCNDQGCTVSIISGTATYVISD